MKARIPQHREFVIDIQEEDDVRRQECWDKLDAILKAYQKQGKSVYTETFIEENEALVQALQSEYKFSYKVELR